MGEEFYQISVDKFIFSVKRDLLYTENDVWAKIENDHFRVGITDYFQRRGGDIIYMEPPKVDSKVKRLEEIVKLETIKTVLSVCSPLDGTVFDVNSILASRPEKINEDPYGEGWLVLITPSNLKEDLERLLTAEKYFEMMGSKIHNELKRVR